MLVPLVLWELAVRHHIAMDFSIQQVVLSQLHQELCLCERILLFVIDLNCRLVAGWICYFLSCAF